MKESAKRQMPELEEVKAETVKGEFAFITTYLTENELENAAKELNVINKIIVNF